MRIGNIKEATPTQIRTLQLRELELLKHLQAILKEHNLSFYIIGGTLIGAVRDGGFIPWDDDIDIIMKRKDFEKFYANRNEWLKGTNFLLERSNEKVSQHLTGITFKDKTTTFINQHSVNENIQHSMSLDIDPLDYRPVGKFKRYLQIIYAIIFSLYNADRVPDHQGKLLRYLAYLPLKMVPTRRAKYKIWSWAEKKMVKLGNPKSGEVVELGVGYKALFRYDDAKWFDKAIPIQFDGMTLPAPVGYDAYLKAVVGDYTKLPPKEEQIPKHTTYLIDTETPYNEKMREPFMEGNIHEKG